MARDPFSDALKTTGAIAVMLAEAQVVIALRMMGMAGFWRLGPGETSRMVTEKADAAVRSGQAAAVAMLTGASPGKVVRAAVKPLRKKTRANAKRLIRKGPATP